MPSRCRRRKSPSTVCQGPYSRGRSRHGTPVRTRHRTPSTNRRAPGPAAHTRRRQQRFKGLPGYVAVERAGAVAGANRDRTGSRSSCGRSTARSCVWACSSRGSGTLFISRLMPAPAELLCPCRLGGWSRTGGAYPPSDQAVLALHRLSTGAAVHRLAIPRSFRRLPCDVSPVRGSSSQGVTMSSRAGLLYPVTSSAWSFAVHALFPPTPSVASCAAEFPHGRRSENVTCQTKSGHSVAAGPDPRHGYRPAGSAGRRNRER